jgi:hypothetical protein
MATLTFTSNTWLKQSEAPAASLPANEKHYLEADPAKVYKVHSFRKEGVHYRIAFLEETFSGRNTWYVYSGHMTLDTGGPPPVTAGSGRGSRQIQNFPYFPQTDNVYNPSGSCNVTCVAMALSYFGVKPKQAGAQLEDELYRFMLNKSWSRHSPYDLKKLVEAYGFKDVFTERGTINTLVQAVNQGSPFIIHGYFTAFGHIVAGFGYTDNAVRIHDPWGEYWASGYDINTRSNPNKGRNLLYSDRLINTVCSPEGPGHIWAHVISRN